MSEFNTTPTGEETPTSGRILVIEPNTLRREFLARAIEGCGYAVQAATDGESGLAEVEAFAPEVVLVQANLPDHNGAEVAAAIKEQHPDTTVVMTSSHPEQLRRTQPKADWVVGVPANLTGLKTVLSKVVAKSPRLN